ncbi:MAG: histone H1 [Candidatus Lokiarchaeota archaeon]|nr:histone H1 [Candidatus Lokiarchaeota archaeon]
MQDLESDAFKFFEKGNKQAGKRLRKGMQKIIVYFKEARKDVSAFRDTL